MKKALRFLQPPTSSRPRCRHRRLFAHGCDFGSKCYGLRAGLCRRGALPTAKSAREGVVCRCGSSIHSSRLALHQMSKLPGGVHQEFDCVLAVGVIQRRFLADNIQFSEIAGLLRNLTLNREIVEGGLPRDPRFINLTRCRVGFYRHLLERPQR